MKAVGIDRERAGHGVRVAIGRRHVPQLLFSVVIDGDLEPEAILLKEIGPAAMPASDEVGKLLGADKWRGGSWALIRHPRAAFTGVNAIADAGRFMVKGTCNQSVDSKAASTGHRGALIGIVDLLVAGGALPVGRFQDSWRGCRRVMVRRAADAAGKQEAEQ